MHCHGVLYSNARTDQTHDSKGAIRVGWVRTARPRAPRARYNFNPLLYDYRELHWHCAAESRAHNFNLQLATIALGRVPESGRELRSGATWCRGCIAARVVTRVHRAAPFGSRVTTVDALSLCRTVLGRFQTRRQSRLTCVVSVPSDFALTSAPSLALEPQNAPVTIQGAVPSAQDTHWLTPARASPCTV